MREKKVSISEREYKKFKEERISYMLESFPDYFYYRKYKNSMINKTIPSNRKPYTHKFLTSKRKRTKQND